MYSAFVGNILLINCKRFLVYFQKVESAPALNFREDFESYKECFRDAWIYILATLLNFSVTLMVFPAVTVLIVPTWGKAFHY